MTDLGDLSLILAGTQYEDGTECIKATFETAGIKTLNDLDNAPRKLTFCICDYSTYPLLAFIRERVVNPPDPAMSEAISKPEEVESEKVELKVEPEAEPESEVKDDQVKE